MLGTQNSGEDAQLRQTIEMFEVITQSQPYDCQSLEILKEAYLKLNLEKEVIQTSKRIAQAYVQLGQLSSAILEYETILQRHPEDVDALAAMTQIENKANNLASMAPPEQEPVSRMISVPSGGSVGKPVSNNVVDDGRQAMFKLFVESKLVTDGDFQLCWQSPGLNECPAKAFDPFIQILAEKAIMALDKSLKLLVDRSRMAYLHMERYDIDVELARSFSRDVCRRWCVIPFDKMSKSVMVATANPFNKQAVYELEQLTKGRLLWYLVSPPELLKLHARIYR